MSFGVGIGDVIVLGKLAWGTYMKLREAPAEVKTICDSVGQLAFRIQSIDVALLRNSDLSEAELEGIKKVIKTSNAILKDIEALMKQFSENKLSWKDRVKWTLHKSEIENIQIRVIWSTLVPATLLIMTSFKRPSRRSRH